MSTARAQRQEINLYGLEFHRADQSFSFRHICRYSLVFFLLLMLIEGYGAWTLWTQQEKLKQSLATQQVVSTRLNRLKQSQPLSQRPKLELQISKLEQQIQQRRELQQIMSGQKLGNVDGFTPYLLSLARRVNTDLSLTHIHLLEGGNVLQLEGWSRVPEAVPRYLQDLRADETFEHVRFGVLNIEKDAQHSRKLKFDLGKSGDKPT